MIEEKTFELRLTEEARTRLGEIIKKARHDMRNILGGQDIRFIRFEAYENVVDPYIDNLRDGDLVFPYDGAISILIDTQTAERYSPVMEVGYNKNPGWYVRKLNHTG